MKKIADKALLFDFYGPLLTVKQGKIWDLYYQKDYSLAEIAEEEGISRQAVHDLLKRTEKILEDYEQKLGLVYRFRKEKEKMIQIEYLLKNITRDDFSNEDSWRNQLEISKKINEIIAENIES